MTRRAAGGDDRPGARDGGATRAERRDPGRVRPVPSSTARLGRRGWAAAGAAAVLVVGGAVGVTSAVAAGREARSGSPGAVASASASAAPGASAARGASAAGSGASASGSGAAADGYQDPATADTSDATPVSVRIPAIGVTSGLEDLHRDGSGALLPPQDWNSAGWFSDGIVPGAVGPAVIAGHVDSPTSAAVFFRLDELVAGDQVQVGMSDGSTRTFTVTRSERAAKSAFPTSDVYGTTPTPQLRLITCDGTFDTRTGHYTDNLIVFASRTDG